MKTRAGTMIELIKNTGWDQIYNFLADGEPPMIARILAINTLFFILFAFRRARGIPAMREKIAVRVQGLLVAANVLILFQNEITSFIGRFG